MDVSIGIHAVGKVVFELYSDITPKTAENFRALCTGEHGNIGLHKGTKKLSYRSTKMHRIIDGFMI